MAAINATRTGSCADEVHRAIAADPRRFAAETYRQARQDIDDEFAVLYGNCLHCRDAAFTESTLTIQVPSRVDRWYAVLTGTAAVVS